MRFDWKMQIRPQKTYDSLSFRKYADLVPRRTQAQNPRTDSTMNPIWHCIFTRNIFPVSGLA